MSNLTTVIDEVIQEQRLYKALTENDAVAIEKAITGGADINAKNLCNDTLLHIALLYERKGIADYLIAKRAKL